MLGYNITEIVDKHLGIFQVDDDSIYQSLPTNEVGWHAGDGNGSGNMKSIGIEICVNSDGNFKRAVENAAWLTKHLMEVL